MALINYRRLDNSKRTSLRSSACAFIAGLQRGQCHWMAVIINRHHRKEAAVRMALLQAANIFCQRLDAHFHRRSAGDVNASQKGDPIGRHLHAHAEPVLGRVCDVVAGHVWRS